MASLDLEASAGPSHDIRVLLPNNTVVLKQIDTSDKYGVDYTVRQSKEALLNSPDVQTHIDITDPTKVTMFLTKGLQIIEMNDNARTIDYLDQIHDDYTLEIRTSPQ